MKENQYVLSVWDEYVSWVHRKWGNKTICIFIHWLASRPHMALHRWFCKELEKSGIDSLRLHMYDAWSRSLSKRWFLSQITEIEAVIQDMSLHYDNIFLIWHSVWWLLTFLVDEEYVTWIIWLDPSILWVYDFKGRMDDIWNIGYKTGSLFEFIVSRKYVDEMLEQWDNYMAQVEVPYLSFFSSQCESYYHHWKKTAHIKDDQEILLIEWSSHSFQEYGKQEKVIEESIQWIQNSI